MSSNAAITVMVIEPDVLLRMAISDYLRECGYRVIEGHAAADVWAVLDSGTTVNVVFAEVQLGGAAEGFSLARDLRQTQPGIDVILASGMADAAEKSTELCEQGPVKKPYHPQQVVKRVQELLERRRASMKQDPSKE